MTRCLILVVLCLAALIQSRHVIRRNDPWLDIARIANSIDSTEVRAKYDQVDCLGMGNLVAKVLQWLFEKNPEISGPEHVKFLIYTRKSKVPHQLATGDNFDIDFSDFKVEKKTVFIVHGFLAHGEESWVKNMTDAYLQLEDVNIVVVDWSGLANTWNYYKAVVNARIAAMEISKFLKQIVETYLHAKNWGKIHMIGHSLGSHVCGLASEEFKKFDTDWKVSRITGLDPAQPCFVASDLSLSKDDADFVDVIHTNGKMIAGMGLGLVDPVGHVDFYPNGGQRQPGCRQNGTTWDNIGIPHSDILEAVCSHRRSYEYFIESLIVAVKDEQSKFWGHKWNRSLIDAVQFIGENCDGTTCTEMGISAVKYGHTGVFFVIAASNSPFYHIDVSDRLDVLEQLQRDGLNKQNSTFYNEPLK